MIISSVNRGVHELEGGVRRVTFELPLGIDHVHCYLLPRNDGSWVDVDTGLGLPDARERWRTVLDELDGPVARILITHFHPDHVGAAADLAELTGAPVAQGREDYEQCVRAWGALRRPERFPDDMRANGVPEDEIDVFRQQAGLLRQMVRFVRDPELLAPGDEIDGWDVLHLPGHADGHIAFLRDGILIAGDALLLSITPNVGLYPDSRPDPLGDYLSSLEHIAELDPRAAYGGHGEAIGDPAGRARELTAHHHERLEQAAESLSADGRTAYELSFALWPEQLAPVLRRFALAETRAHLEYLVLRDQAVRADGDGRVVYSLSA
jgi:glyoxylase-like metal-dependent hydrolase (beta-lactamase superfamily II)